MFDSVIVLLKKLQLKVLSDQDFTLQQLPSPSPRDGLFVYKKKIAFLSLEVLINDILGNFEENDYALIEFIDLRISEKTIIRLKNKENIEIFKEN